MCQFYEHVQLCRCWSACPAQSCLAHVGCTAISQMDNPLLLDTYINNLKQGYHTDHITKKQHTPCHLLPCLPASRLPARIVYGQKAGLQSQQALAPFGPIYMFISIVFCLQVIGTCGPVWMCEFNIEYAGRGKRPVLISSWKHQVATHQLVKQPTLKSKRPFLNIFKLEVSRRLHRQHSNLTILLHPSTTRQRY